MMDSPWVTEHNKLVLAERKTELDKRLKSLEQSMEDCRHTTLKKDYTEAVDWLVRHAPELAEHSVEMNTERFSVQLVARAYNEHVRVVASDVKTRYETWKREQKPIAPPKLAVIGGSKDIYQTTPEERERGARITEEVIAELEADRRAKAKGTYHNDYEFGEPVWDEMTETERLECRQDIWTATLPYMCALIDSFHEHSVHANVASFLVQQLESLVEGKLDNE